MKYVIEILEKELETCNNYAQLPEFVRDLDDITGKGLEFYKGLALERIPQIQEAIKILNAQIESLNVTGNECEKKVCVRCGLTADGTLYDEPMCEGCLHINT